MMKKFTIVALVLVLVLSLNVVAIANAQSNETREAFLDEQNWIQLDGYTYLSKNEKGSTTYPAVITFGGSDGIPDIGINYKSNPNGNGYYQPGERAYSGIIYKDKVDLTNFSIVFSINKVGANAGQDAWIGIGLMKEPKLWDSVDGIYNSGAIALFRRSGSIELTSYIHEITPNYNSFTNASIGIPTFRMNRTIEGALLKYEIRREGEAEPYTYRARLSEIKYDENGSEVVLRTRDYGNPLSKGAEYFVDGKAYLAISASTENPNRPWDFSIKRINNIVLGTQSDVEPKTPAEISESIYTLINELDVYSNIEPVFDGGTYSGVRFTDSYNDIYTPDDEEITEKAIEFYRLLTDVDNDVLNLLAQTDTIGGYYFGSDLAKLVDFYKDCADLIMGTIEGITAQRLVDEFVSALALLEDYENLTEKELRDRVENAKYLYNKMTVTSGAIDLYEENSENMAVTEILALFDDIDELLEQLALGRYLDLLDELETLITAAGGVNITMDNVWDYMEKAVPAEETYDTFTQDFKDENFLNEGAPYAGKKQTLDSVFEAINQLKENPQNIDTIESYERTALILLNIFYIPENANSAHLQVVFDVVNDYNLLPQSLKDKISSENKQHLATAAKNSLKDAISALPAINSDNYLLLGETLENLRSSIIALEYLDASSLPDNKNVFEEKYFIYLVNYYPLGTKAYTVNEAYNVGEEIKISLSDLFDNRNDLDLTYTVSGGATISGNYLVLVPTEAKEYVITVTAANEQYNQSVSKTLQFNCVGGSSSGCGCGAGLNAGTFAIAGLLLLISALYIFKRKQEE